MDKTFIKMADCPEIQGLVKIDADPEDFWKGYKDGTLVATPNLGIITVKKGNRLIWLPRQEDLQKMVSFSLYTLLDEFDKWWRNASPIHQDAQLQLNLSMEQLWLAFVMKELHNKVWKEGKWIT